jgi:Zn-dependent peptidase ImmA (M78 family)
MSTKILINKKLVNSKVSALLRSFPQLIAPVNIEELATMRGIKVIPYPLSDDVSGLLSLQDGEATIGYNIKEATTRRRFTIAHELGHYELHRDKSDLFIDKQFIYRSQTSGDTPVNQAMEQEANAFASAILMPTDLLRKEIQQTKLNLMDGDAIEKLAKRFDVSTTAMSIRISGLGFF